MKRPVNGQCRGIKNKEIEEIFISRGVGAARCPQLVFTARGRCAGVAERGWGGSWPAGLKRFTVGCARVTRLTNTTRASRSFCLYGPVLFTFIIFLF